MLKLADNYTVSNVTVHITLNGIAIYMSAKGADKEHPDIFKENVLADISSQMKETRGYFDIDGELDGNLNGES